MVSWQDVDLYERIIKKKVEDTGYNMKVAEQKFRQEKAAHETALRELENCKRDKEDIKFVSFMKAVIK